MKKIIDKLVQVINGISNAISGNRPEFEFPVDVPAGQTGPKLWVEKGNTRIMIYYGELDFYRANGWVTL